MIALTIVLLIAATEAQDSAQSRRREVTIDFVALLPDAEFVLPQGGKLPSLVGDGPKNSDDDDLEATVSVGTTLRFKDVPVHDGARLYFAVGRSKLSREPVQPVVHCSLAFERADGTRELLAEVDVRSESSRVEGEVDLVRLRGECGTLVCATAGPDPSRFVAWSRLSLQSEGRPQEPRDRILWIESEAYDLAAGKAAVTLPVPGAFEQRVTVPESARLRFYVAVSGATAASVRIRVTIDGKPVARSVPSHGRVARDLAREDYDLSAYAGRDVALAIGTVARSQESVEKLSVLLGQPRIVTQRSVPRVPRNSSAPDVFLIVVDTLRADSVGCYGAVRPTTPRLDAFASSSLVYETAYSQCSWTLPSIATILTGLHQDDHGVRDFESNWLADEHETIAEVLAAHGISCGAFVSNSLVAEASNYNQGFETFRNLNWSNARKVVRNVFDWLDERADDRVFAYVHFVDPHSPYDAPAGASESFDVPGNPHAGRTYDELASLFEKSLEAKTPLSEADMKSAISRSRSLYDTETRYWDRWFGELIDGLRARGRLDQSVILVTADHGEEFLEHGSFFHGHHLHDELVRVPFVLRAPKLTPGRVTTPIDGRQTKPLLLSLLGLDGLVSAEPGETPDARARAHFPDSILLATDWGQAGVGHAVRRDAVVRGRWKLIDTPELAQVELFDLEHDPGELDDCSEREPKIRGALAELLQGWRDEHARLSNLRWSPSSLELRDQLRALGYVR